MPRTAPSASVSFLTTSSLCGIVTLRPRMPNAGASSMNRERSSRGTRIGMYTLLKLPCRKATLWTSGLRLCPIGSAITP